MPHNEFVTKASHITIQNNNVVCISEGRTEATSANLLLDDEIIIVIDYFSDYMLRVLSVYGSFGDQAWD